jgi:hypothetical protein
MLKIVANLLFSDNDLSINAKNINCRLHIRDIFYEIKRISIFVLYIFRIYSNNNSLS